MDQYTFAGAMWLFSRLFIAMLLITLYWLHRGIKPTVGWEVFYMWDSLLYDQIATSGYEYMPMMARDIMLPLPPVSLVIRAVMTLGLLFNVAGTLVNNLAFLVRCSFCTVGSRL